MISYNINYIIIYSIRDFNFFNFLFKSYYFELGENKLIYVVYEKKKFGDELI